MHSQVAIFKQLARVLKSFQALFEDSPAKQSSYVVVNQLIQKAKKVSRLGKLIGDSGTILRFFRGEKTVIQLALHEASTLRGHAWGTCKAW